MEEVVSDVVANHYRTETGKIKLTLMFNHGFIDWVA